MKKLDIIHHKIIMLVLLVLVLITGILFGVKVNYAAGLSGMLIIIFAMLFLIVFLLFNIFTQLVHIQDDKKVKRK